MKVEDLIAALPDNYSLEDREMILRACRVAEEAHKNQTRASGEPYINHCLAVAQILAELQVPPDTVIAGILHDTVEDTTITIDELKLEFNDEVAKMVNGVTKLTKLPRVSRADQSIKEDEQEELARQLAERRGTLAPVDDLERITRSRKHELMQENMRKTFIAMGDDVRVVLIKLADRLHNMRTLGHLPENKRRRIAQETLDIFAPLANRLGIWQIKWELEDLGFRYTEPEKYKEIARNLADDRSRCSVRAQRDGVVAGRSGDRQDPLGE